MVHTDASEAKGVASRVAAASVLIQKFLTSLSVHVEGTAAEPLDRCKDIVGCLDPAECPGACIAVVDEGLDGCDEVGYGAVGATLDLACRTAVRRSARPD